ncbi:MAG TPA: 50S ribosomal protein L32e, partial [Candidatus Aenigmarchaeota archaeon]|nr:50S ribosomal protein L32e [Candidatus Aenigmarchaeota archaeon]
MRLIFERTEFERFKKLKRCWRKPRGLHNKLRLGK